MPYFFCSQNLAVGAVVTIEGQEARHILLSQRIKAKEKIKLQGPDAKRFLAEVLSRQKNSLLAKVLKPIASFLEPKIPIVIFQSLVSEKALDFILQKAVELGAKKIILFNSQNTAVKFSPDLFNKKTPRWQKILGEASKQCERSLVPSLESFKDLQSVTKQLDDYEAVFLADLSGEKSSAKLANLRSAAVLIGPEGGFSEAEIMALKQLKNLKTLCLSPFILKAETAALAALSVLRQVLD